MWNIEVDEESAVSAQVDRLNLLSWSSIKIKERKLLKHDTNLLKVGSWQHVLRCAVVEQENLFRLT